jgi:hypothetical protein
MPLLTKQVISQYFLTECQRQLRLSLAPPHNQAYALERSTQHMPAPQHPRPGLTQITELGKTWEAEKLDDLTRTFGTGTLIGNPVVHHTGQTRYHPIPLTQALTQANPYCLLVEAEYDLGAGSTPSTFESALGIAPYRSRWQLAYSALRPDLIQVLPPGTHHACITPRGEVCPLPVGDARHQLRVIDIKLAAEPSIGYFAEVAYYMMALAGWLTDEGFDHQFVVIPDGAVWPGSQQAARLMVAFNKAAAQGVTLTTQQLLAAWEADLEPVPFEVLAGRLRRFLGEELPAILQVPWQTLPWHVDGHCGGCDYLGFPWPKAQPDPDLCMPSAAQHDRLSRVAFISRGAAGTLETQGIATVARLAQLPATSPAFDQHHALRTARTVVASRAAALATQLAQIAPQSGTSAIMPRWADLHLYLTADFDRASSLTFAFGVQAFWREPRPSSASTAIPPRTQPWPAQSFIVDLRSAQTEEREILALLHHIRDILSWARQQDPSTSMQVYLWDQRTYDQFTAVLGRHLQAILHDRTIADLAWLFPAEEILPNAALATRRSPITVVRQVVQSLLALPIAHYYSLLEVARVYHPAQTPPNIAAFAVNSFFEDALSDLIPHERAHEIWVRSMGTPNWQQQLMTLDRTVRTRLRALQAIVQRLETDLGATLGQTAPPIRIGPPRYQNRISMDGQLWYAFAKLDAALAELEVQQVRAMPPHERAARFDSARLEYRLSGAQEQQALAALQLPARAGRRVYQMRPDSREVKLREGDFTVALAPEARPGFLDESLMRITSNTPLQPSSGAAWQQRMEEVTGVSVVALDRQAGLVVLDPNARWPTMLDDLERHGLANFSVDTVLDPTYRDYFSNRLLETLRAIGNPPTARANPLVAQATGRLTGSGARPSAHVPPADFLWDALGMYGSAVSRQLAPAQRALIQAGVQLNPSQWNAWQEALSRRLQLIWGPPGTGKSRTVRAIVLGAAVEAAQQSRSLRVLVCAATYTALDNVLLEVAQDLPRVLPGAPVSCARLRSYRQPPPVTLPAAVSDLAINRANPSPQAQALRAQLTIPTTASAGAITIVGATPGQIHNLLIMQQGSAQQEIFDLIAVDEASQMDVMSAILPLAALAAGGSIVLAGDPLQLPPIHQAKAPTGLEDMVGSVYTFARRFQQVPDLMLTTNYRSNQTLVDLAPQVGYLPTLTSHSSALRLQFVHPLPTTRPANWPNAVHWTPEWSALLNPDQPATCFIYPDGKSSQWNPFEAEAVAALVWLLSQGLCGQLLGECDPITGQPVPIMPAARYAPQDFWTRGVGVVTPHRAQQGLIVSRLLTLFAATGVAPSVIRDAVDTVERFQGQQRDVMIASFALGDPDVIREEDEFLMSLNRFNVMTSRARAKLIVLVSQQVVDHLSDDLETLRASRLLKVYAEGFCDQSQRLTLGYLDQGAPRSVDGILRYRQ